MSRFILSLLTLTLITLSVACADKTLGNRDTDGGRTCENGCDDGVDCTLDECIDGYCSSTPRNEACAQGHCDAILGCTECTQASDCDDFISCTVDTCAAQVCTHAVDNSLCPGDLLCDPSAGCVGCTTDMDCDDGVACTDDTCSGSICNNVPNNDYCTGESGVCNPTTGCSECQTHDDCSDGIACNGDESCSAGSCHPGTALDCDDGVHCTLDSCSEADGGTCTNTPDDSLCSFGETCELLSGCEGPRTFFAHTSSQLYIIDMEPTVPTATLIGSFGAQITDIAEAVDGTLYGVGFYDFYTINRTTGAATLVGSLGLGTSIEVNGLTVAPDGTIYAGSNTETGGRLYRVNPATGAATSAGGFGTNISSSGDIVWGPSGLIYVTDPDGDTDRIVTVDPSTGAASPLFNTPYDEIYGLTYTAGELIGLTGGGDLVLIDVDAGTTSQIVDLEHAWWGAS